MFTLLPLYFFLALSGLTIGFSPPFTLLGAHLTQLPYDFFRRSHRFWMAFPWLSHCFYILFTQSKAYPTLSPGVTLVFTRLSLGCQLTLQGFHIAWLK